MKVFQKIILSVLLLLTLVVGFFRLNLSMDFRLQNRPQL